MPVDTRMAGAGTMSIGYPLFDPYKGTRAPAVALGARASGRSRASANFDRSARRTNACS